MSAPSPPPQPPTDDLAEGHIALVIEDAVAELDAASPALDLRPALLYGWATGAVASRDLALRSATDDGLRHLLNGRALSFQEVREYREEHQEDLEAFAAAIFELLAQAGAVRLR